MSQEILPYFPLNPATPTADREETKQEENFTGRTLNLEPTPQALPVLLYAPVTPIEIEPVKELKEYFSISQDLETKISRELHSIKPKFKTYTGFEQKLETEKDRSRQDVVNKTMLRMVRRFYHRLFIQDNKKLLKKRYRNVEFSTTLEACKEIVKTYLKIDNRPGLPLFLLLFIGIKYKEDQLSEEIKQGKGHRQSYS